jgi:hypothetical protein
MPQRRGSYLQGTNPVFARIDGAGKRSALAISGQVEAFLLLRSNGATSSRTNDAQALPQRSHGKRVTGSHELHFELRTVPPPPAPTRAAILASDSPQAS